MSDRILIEPTHHCAIDTINGRLVVSSHPDDKTIGILVERDGLFGGTLLTLSQAEELSGLLLDRLRLR